MYFLGGIGEVNHVHLRLCHMIYYNANGDKKYPRLGGIGLNH